MGAIRTFINDYLVWLSMPNITIIDILEIFIIAYVMYHLIIWVKDTRAWVLLKGISVVIIFYLIALLLGMNVILWIFSNSLSVVIMAVIIVFQPELRRALEQLGTKNIFRSIIPFEEEKPVEGAFSNKTVSELVKACYEMAKVKTGALIVIEQSVPLAEYERTGIQLDSLVSSQLLINIFEHNTPLHDGAIIIKGNRITAATCYLPLSDNLELSKELGTRHRAGVGISEVTDSFTIIVSEETGKVSVAQQGRLIRDIDGDSLRKRLGGLTRTSYRKQDKKKFRKFKKNKKDKADKKNKTDKENKMENKTGGKAEK